MMSNSSMHPLHDSLSEREQAILRLLAEGLSDQQIADELFLSLHTAKWYNRQIYSKLGVSSWRQAIAVHAPTQSPHRNTFLIRFSFQTSSNRQIREKEYLS